MLATPHPGSARRVFDPKPPEELSRIAFLSAPRGRSACWYYC
jgi:hypothetical protein